MNGICCICRKSIGAGRVAAKRVVTSFTLSHYGLCPACLSRTRSDISRIYGQSAVGQGVAPVGPMAPEKGPGV